MQKSNIIIFGIILLIVILVFGIAIWGAKKDVKSQMQTNEIIENNIETNVTEEQIVNTAGNEINTGNTSVNQEYLGTWYISQLNYDNVNSVNIATERKENGELTQEEYNEIISSDINVNNAVLTVKSITDTNAILDFKLEGQAPDRNVGEIKDINVPLENNVGNFTYIDSLGNEGKGTVSFSNNQVLLNLETTKEVEGAQWSIAGSYKLEYKLVE